MVGKIHLRATTESDLPIFYQQQLDPEANIMAAFTAADPTDRAAFDTHWAKIMADEKTTNRTILLAEAVAGHVASFERFGDLEVTYWIGKEYWGRGIATVALKQFLAEQKQRPIVARAAQDNIGSIRVLEKCGFKISGSDRAFANARGLDVDEVIMELK